MYSCHFGLDSFFDVFVCTYVPNDKTPPIQVQIRSNSLWLDGIKDSFDKAYKCVEDVLASFDIKIKETQENRIDYAFHTNYINDLMNFFPEKDLKRMQISNFGRAEKQYDLQTFSDDEEIESDYLLIGRKKSNNALFVAYNKTKEVIEQGYKQFFIPVWKKYGLINDFDVWLLEKAFKKGKYEEKDRARCEFYYDYGKDDEIRREIYSKLQNPDTPLKWFKKRAKGLVPDMTIITNIEIRTKRKIYERLKKPFVTNDKTPKKNIYSIFNQMSEIISFITEETIRFVKYKGEHEQTERTKRPMADWWVRLRNAKKIEIENMLDIDYIRQYEHDLNLERQKSLTLNKLAGAGAFLNVTTGVFEYAKVKNKENKPRKDILTDFQRFYGELNDNDFRKYGIIRDKRQKDILRRRNE
ncbi:MAG: hypothetical protein LBD23_01490 [Oscillospiraceae bacterium]|jgi:hypothetical protein|nr:hypothetical protein [Oscillospiraceae bacterium]